MINGFRKIHVVQMKCFCGSLVVIHLLQIEFLGQHIAQRGVECIDMRDYVVVVSGQFGAEIEEIVDGTVDRQKGTFFR